MKRTFTLFLISLNLSAYSQVNFFQDGATWGYYTCDCPDIWGDPYREWYDQYTIVGDTVINSTVYKNIHTIGENKVWSSPSTLISINYYNYYSALRYDSTFQKVYYYDNSTSTDTLIYDFNLSLGDTVPHLQFVAYVDSIDTISIGGFQLRKFYYVPDSSYSIWPNENYFIEGLGSNNGLIFFNPDFMSVSGGVGTELICFQLDSIYYPTNPVCDIFTSVNNEYNFRKNISVFPNPSGNNFHVVGPDISEDYSLMIYDHLGRKIISKNFIGELEISDLPFAGLFLVEVYSNGRIIGKSKLVKN